MKLPRARTRGEGPRFRRWIGEPLSLAGAVLLTAAGAGIGWRVHLLPGAGTGAAIGLLVAVLLAVFVGHGWR
jgi:hypothetical protein